MNVALGTLSLFVNRYDFECILLVLSQRVHRVQGLVEGNEISLCPRCGACNFVIDDIASDLGTTVIQGHLPYKRDGASFRRRVGKVAWDRWHDCSEALESR